MRQPLTLLAALAAAAGSCLPLLGALKPSLSMSVSPATAPPGAAASVDCSFLPAVTYIFWSFSPDGASWEKVAMCYTVTSQCKLHGQFANMTDSVAPLPNGTLRILSVGRQHDGGYACEGIRGTDAAKAFGTFTVITAASRAQIAGPQEAVSAGTVANFSCASSGGNPTPQLLWRRRRREDATPQQLPPEASSQPPPAAKFGTVVSRLLLTPQPEDHLAVFTCVSLHPLANSTSGDVLLSVKYAPIIDPTPAQRVIVGDTVNMSCTAAANPPPLVKLVHGTSSISRTSLHSVSHSTASVRKQQAGNYSCVASNSEGESWLSFYVDVMYAPEITVRSSLVAREGSQLSVQCRVAANPPAHSVTWRHEASGSVRSNDSVLLLDSVRRADAGQWTCEARNLLSPSNRPSRELAAQAGAGLIVEYRPAAPIVSISRSSVLVGTHVLLVCEPSTDSPGVPVPSFAWHRNGAAGAEPLHRGPTLRLGPLELRHSGRYSCTPSNSVGVGPPAVVNLQVDQAPSWIAAREERPVTAAAGATNYSIDCSVQAKPRAAVKWFKDGAEISAADYSVYTEFDDTNFRTISVLRFTSPTRSSLRPEDNGEFLCSAQNSHGKISRSVRLVVEFAPIILASPAKVALTGPTVSLECQFLSQPEPTVTWQLHGATHVGNLVADTLVRHRYTSSLLGVGAAGRYACVVQNRLGSARRSLSVVPAGRPEAPAAARADAVAWDSVVVAWTPGFDGGHPAEYFVSYEALDAAGRFGDEAPLAGNLAAGSDAVANVSGLLPDTNYSLTVAAGNRLGRSEASLTTFARTRPLALPQIGGVYRRGAQLHFDAAVGHCVRVEASADAGSSWAPFRRCVPSGDGLVSGVDFSFAYRLSVCLPARSYICGQPVATGDSSGLPEVGAAAIGAVAAACGAVIACLLAVLAACCCRGRRRRKGASADVSDDRQLRVEQEKKLGPGGRPYAMISPHPSVASCEEVGHSTGRVFATLLSANSPVAAHNGDSSESENSNGTLLQTQRKVIYEVVV